MRFFSLLLTAIFVLGFLVRIIGTNPGYPPNHPDEPIIYSTAINMVTKLQPDPFRFGTYRFQYPGFVIYLHAFLYAFVFIPLTTFLTILRHPLSFLSQDSLDSFFRLFIFGKSYINTLFWGRTTTAFLGFLSLPLVYLIGKRFFDRNVGLLAALFLAVNFRHIISSQLSLVDAPNATVALLVLFASLLLLKEPTRRHYILAGISVGISLATKLYIFSFLPFFLSHVIISLGKKEWMNKVGAFFSRSFLLSILGIVVVFVVLNPFLFLHLPQAIHTQTLNNLRYAFGEKVLITTPLWYLFDVGIGEIPVILALVGLIFALAKTSYRMKSMYLLLFILPPSFVLFYYSSGGVYIRNFASVIPFILVFSAIGLTEAVKKGIKLLKISILNKHVLPMLLVLGFLANIENINNSFTMTFWNAKTWNQECAEKGMNELPTGKAIARTPVAPLVRPKELRYVDFTNNFDHRTAFTLRELQEDGVDYVEIDYSPTQAYFLWWVGGNKFKDMPIDILDNSFPGLVFKELSRYTVLDCFKPWQSLDHNYSIIQIPPKIQIGNLTSLKHYTFDTTDGNETINCRDGMCLRIKAAAFNSTADWFSLFEPIPVEPGKMYVVSASVAATKLVPKTQRDGFFRIDFYKSPPHSKERGITATISPRYFGEGWQEKETYAIAPKEARYMTIGFQTADGKTDFLIDDLQVFVSDNISSEELKAANAKEIDNMILYPNSIL